VSTLRATGPISALRNDARRALLDRVSEGSSTTIRERVAAIITRVRDEGDEALRAIAREFDGCVLTSIEVPRAAWDAALARVDADVVRAMRRAAANIEAVHTAFLPTAIETVTADGVIIGRRPDPLGRVGVYAPGGRAAYPSSVLMGVVPARVAGVGEIVVCSPPGPNGAPSDVVLAAAAIGGAHRVFALGGAGAVAAMAYGTDTVSRVDRIVGPGNAYVAEAKLQVVSVVGIDSPAGPSELLVLADASASPAVVAREVMAQAEHDPLASVVVVATDADWAATLEREITERIPLEPRADVIAEALAARGGVIVADSVDEVLEFAAEYAAEHLLLAGDVAATWLPRVMNAGTIFVGETSSVAFGDYMTGANHVLPTGGLARAYSGLSTLDFVRWTTYQLVSREAAAALANDVDIFARAEGLPAHAAAARQWSVS
jgi:histidinol dehydrogenase